MQGIRSSILSRMLLFVLAMTNFLWLSAFTEGQDLQGFAPGPLRVHPTNPRYFTDGTRNADGSMRAIYLTGSHTWNSLVDIGPSNPPPAFDNGAYLDFLERNHHNFVRLWTEEEFAWEVRQPSKSPVQNFMSPLPWSRTNAGIALDGQAKFDLTKFNPEYFDRLRSRIEAAGKRGIYVSVMLFEGWVQQDRAEWWKTHPFHKENNGNGIDGDANGDGRGTDIHTLSNAAVTRLQENYIRKVIDSVGDLDNVLYEIVNECGTYSTEWQYHMIRFIKQYEASRPKQHPVGMTFQWSPNSKLRGTNQILFDSPADWISPNQEAGEWNYKSNPPPADGRKVIIPDTDHLGGIWGEVPWVWKSFTRGHNPIFMDPYDGSVLGDRSSKWEAIRASLGVTNQVAQRLDLGAMTPHGELVSTNYCLAQPGVAYVIYLPTAGEVTVDLTEASGQFRVDWIAPIKGSITQGSPATGGTKQRFLAPFEGDAVLQLSKIIADSK